MLLDVVCLLKHLLILTSNEWACTWVTESREKISDEKGHRKPFQQKKRGLFLKAVLSHFVTYYNVHDSANTVERVNQSIIF